MPTRVLLFDDLFYLADLLLNFAATHLDLGGEVNGIVIRSPSDKPQTIPRPQNAFAGRLGRGTAEVCEPPNKGVGEDRLFTKDLLYFADLLLDLATDLFSGAVVLEFGVARDLAGDLFHVAFDLVALASDLVFQTGFHRSCSLAWEKGKDQPSQRMLSPLSSIFYAHHLNI